MPEPRNQGEVVKKFLEEHTETVKRDKLRIPGLEILHTKPFDEQAETLVNILKSRKGIREIRWVLGEFIEIVWE